MLLAILAPFNRYTVLNRVTAQFLYKFPYQAEVNPVLFTDAANQNGQVCLDKTCHSK